MIRSRTVHAAARNPGTPDLRQPTKPLVTLRRRHVRQTEDHIHQRLPDTPVRLNQQHPRIKFTTEIESDSRITFLNTWVNQEPDGSTSITIHRKKTHTDQYLDFASNHPVRQKMGIISTMKHRIDTLVTKPKEKEKELDYVKFNNYIG